MRVKCLVQEHNTMTRTGLELGPLDPESSAPEERATYAWNMALTAVAPFKGLTICKMCNMLYDV